MGETQERRDEFARPARYDVPAGVAQVAAAVSGRPLPPRPQTRPEGGK